MGLVSKTFTFSAGAVIVASQHNTNFDTLYNVVNGSLDGTNLASNAAIADTQLNQITTAGKVSAAAITIGSQAQGDLLYASSASAWARLGAGTAGKCLKTGGAAANPAWSTNFPVEGNVASVLRKLSITIAAGGTPGTNFTTTTTADYNNPTVTDATDLGVSGSSGSWALNAGGTIFTLDLTADVVAIMGIGIIAQKVKNASAAAGDVFFVNNAVSSSNIIITLTKQGSNTSQDWRTVLTTAGDNYVFTVCFITST